FPASEVARDCKVVMEFTFYFCPPARKKLYSSLKFMFSTAGLLLSISTHQELWAELSLTPEPWESPSRRFVQLISTALCDAFSHIPLASARARTGDSIMKIFRYVMMAALLFALTGVARAFTFQVLDPSGSPFPVTPGVAFEAQFDGCN